MRFYADVNFHRAAVIELRRRGVDFLTAQEDGRERTADPELLDRATALGRVLCTHDDDFTVEATRRQRGGIPFAGVVFARQQRISIGDLVGDILLLSEATDEAYWSSHIEFLPL